MTRAPVIPEAREPDYIPDGPIHTWFELSYASYLTLPRSVLQSMPLEWQERFVACLDELRAEFGYLDWPRYTVSARTADGRFRRDPIPHYWRGRTRLRPASVPEMREIRP
jgi:hypothetical protein